MRNVKWSEEEISLLKKEYSLATKGTKYLIPLFPGRTKKAIHAKAEELNLKNSYHGRKCEYDINFWRDYNKLNCYWAGFGAADGSISQEKRGSARFSLQIVEDYHLKNFIKDTKSTYSLQKLKLRSPSQQIYQVKYSVGKEWEDDLKNNFNIVPRKTYCMSAPKQIPKELFPYFLIGFIDGDGCWCLDKNMKFRLGFKGATKEILQFINNWIDENYSSKSNKSRNVNIFGNVYSLSVSGFIACQMYLDLRQLIPERHLARKWDDPVKIKYCEDYIALHKKSDKV